MRCCSLVGDRLLADSDTYWQIAVGRWILDHRALPSVDIYSFTKAGAPWVSSSWLAQVLFAKAYDLAGWTGPAALAAACSAATFALLTAILSRALPAIHASLIALAALVLTCGHLLARPHVLVLPHHDGLGERPDEPPASAARRPRSGCCR